MTEDSQTTDRTEQAPPPADDSRDKPGFLFILFCLAVLLFGWTAIASLYQGGWAGCGEALAWIIGSFFAVFLLIHVHESQRYGSAIVLAPLAVTLVLFWLLAVGTLEAFQRRDWIALAWDLGPLVLAALLAAPLSRWLGKLPWPTKTEITWRQELDWEWGSVQTLVWFVLAWTLVSVVTFARVDPLPRDVERLRPGTLALDVPIPPSWSDLRLGLALSGGGYRAAVFHAGVLQSLEELGFQPDNLSTVSGGSIIGAYYSQGGDPAAFVDAVAEGRFDLKRQLLAAHNALRLPFPMRLAGTSTELAPLCRFDRLDVQTRYLDRVLFPPESSGESLRHRSPQGTDDPRPHLMIATTDLTYGFQVGLLPDGVLLAGGPTERDVLRGETFRPESDLSLAERVALSGAFPGAFPGRPWRVRVQPLRGTGDGWRNLVLVDGGVRDNLGWELLRAARTQAAKPGEDGPHSLPHHWRTDVLLISDGGAAFGVLDDADQLLTQVSRTVEVAGAPLRPGPSRHNYRPGTTAESQRAYACENIERSPPAFSPADRLPRPTRQFLVQHDSVSPGGTNAPLNTGFDPSRYPQAILHRLVELLETRVDGRVADEPVADGQPLTLRAQLDAYLSAWGSHQSRGPQWSMPFDRADLACRQSPRPTMVSVGQREYPLLAGTCEGRAFRRTILDALRADLEVFYNTPTLADRLAPPVAEALERLGQVLVYLEWPHLKTQFEHAVVCASPVPAATSRPLPPPADAPPPERAERRTPSG